MRTNYIAKFFSMVGVLVIALTNAQVGINTISPKATLQIDGKDPVNKVEGIMIPKYTGDQIYNMPVPTGVVNEGNLVYATSAASTANQTGKGELLTGKGFYYWNGTKWVTFVTTVINNLWSQVKPMNMLLSDNDSYTSPSIPLVAPTGPAVKKFDADFYGTGDYRIVNNPLNLTMWDNTNSLIVVPQQLLGYTMTINLSLKFQKLSSNAESCRLVAFTGNTTVNLTTGGYDSTTGRKIKDLMFTGTKTAVGTVETNYVRDELVLSPIIITQDIIDNGIKLYIGSAMNGEINFYEPVLTVDYGVVNTAL